MTVPAGLPARMPEPRPRPAILGPLVGSNPGFVGTPGDTLEASLRRRGYEPVVSSRSTNRWRRLFEIPVTLTRRGRDLDVVVLLVYGGRSFVVEELASAVAARQGLPIVMTLHGGAMPEFMDRFPSWSSRVLSRARRLVVPSPYLARELARRGFSAEVIPNSIDLVRYSSRVRERARPRMLWMRAFHALYNPALAVETLARVRLRHPDALLTLAGQDRGEEPTLRRLVERLGLSDHVRFVGFLDAAGKAREADSCDLFLNTNRVDNQPVAVVEACAMGLPVVATAVGGIPDLLTDGETGLLVPDGNADAMAAAVCRLVEDAELCARLSGGGRRLAAEFDEPRVTDRWEALLAAASRPGVA
jgi:glycosyltransferase involved in cell wall biosynthesis